VAVAIAQFSLTSKNKSRYVNIISFLKKLQAVRHISYFFPLIEVGPISPKSRFFNKQTVASKVVQCGTKILAVPCLSGDEI
jgi:hypothetical protein